MINYISTRDPSHKVTSSRAILSGQAPDGGLYIPENLEDIKCDYHDILSDDFRSMAESVWNIFFPDYGNDKISDLVEKSYRGKFSAPEITPLVKVGNSSVLELYHGPTSAFKDVALSALPNLLTAAREMNDFTDEIMILTATSGDTGSAALFGFGDVPGTRIVVFYPYGGVSETQRLQMVTAPGENASACAIRGNFDDAQTGVKALFREIPQPVSGVSLSSANSINIGRLVPQIVYYFAAYSQLLASGEIADGDKVDFKSIVEYPNVDRPGNNDNWNDYTLAVDANQNGYVLINRKLAKSSNRNYAKNMAFTRFNESGRIDDAVYPLYDTPFRGADSEGAAINDNNFIVGWAGRRDDHRAVVGGSYRDVEALFYNINNRSYNYINDLICHKNENGDKDCRAQDGKYYYISWAVDINNDNLIFATAFRYNSEKDWSNSVNAEVVPVILRPTDDAFVKDDKGNTVINQKKVVSYERPQNKNYSRDRGGCLDFISVLLLVSGAAVLRRRKRHV